MPDYKYMNHDGWYQLRSYVVNNKLEDIKESVKSSIEIHHSDVSMYLADCCQLSILNHKRDIIDWCLAQKELDVEHPCHIEVSDWSETDMDYGSSTTLIKQCVESCDTETLDKLLKLGAKFPTDKYESMGDVYDFSEIVGMAVCKADDCSKMLPYLEAHGVSYKEFLDNLVIEALKFGKLENVKWLIENGANPNARTRDSAKEPLAMMAAYLNSNPNYSADVKDPHDFFDWLLSHGADPNLMDTMTSGEITYKGGISLIEHLLDDIHSYDGSTTLLKPDVFDNTMVILKKICDILKKHNYDFCAYGGRTLCEVFNDNDPKDVAVKQALLDKQKEDKTVIPLWLVEHALKTQKFPKTAEKRLKQIQVFFKSYME